MLLSQRLFSWKCHSRLPLTTVLKGFRSEKRITRQVTTWSPLASVFNTKPQEKFGISLARDNVGLFGISELKDHTGFYLLKQSACIEAEDLVKEATSSHRKRKLVVIFDELSDTLCKVADMADFVRLSHPDHRFSQAAEEACVNISGLVEKLNTNVDIHKALQNVIEHGDKFASDEVDKRVAELFMFDFEQSGIQLPEEMRKEFVCLNEEILVLGTVFQQGCHKVISLPKDKLPERLKYAFAIDGDNVTVSGLFSDHSNDLIREAAYRLYLHPDSYQIEVLESLLQKRYQLAKLVGFPSYAHRALRGTMAETPENVMIFLESLAEKLRPKAEKDFNQLSKLKSKCGSLSNEVMPWDVPFYSGLARNQQCRVDNSELAPYFSLGACIDGLRMLFTSLYGVDLVCEKNHLGEVWHSDVHKLAVVHETQGTLGYIYCDLFERAGKPRQDCHFTIRGGRMTDSGTYQNPVVVLMLNFPQQRSRMPSLLTPDMVENLFHEFGHAMHSMLGRTRYQHVTGTRCPTDFAEVPSVLMEYFFSDPRVLSQFARHWETGEPLPQEKISNLCSAKNMFAASELQLQVFYSILDQVYHGLPQPKSTTEIIESVQNKYYGLPYVPNTAWQMRFGHFVGYGAKYYSYLMSRAVASKIWQKCFQLDPFSRSMGEKYKKKMLAHGGGVHPQNLVEDMLGEKPTAEVLVNALIDDIEPISLNQ